MTSSEDDQKRAAAVFFQETLGKLAGMPVVTVTCVQNARSRKDFLGDGRLAADKIQFRDGRESRRVSAGRPVSL